MWQKLNRIDIYDLEIARIQLLNAIQLVSAAPRSYLKNSKDNRDDWLMWDVGTNSMISKVFGTKEKIRVALDFEQFILSLFGKKDHIEHLVLSGITYPMAFGWMKIKLDSYHLKGEKYNDDSIYSIDHTLGVNDEMNVTKQIVFNDLTIYFSNAFKLFIQLEKELNFHGTTLINPKNMNLVLIPKEEEQRFYFGFSPGDQDYPEPYFYIQLNKTDEHIINQLKETNEIWNTKNWSGLVFLASEFLTLDQDDEKNRVLDFFKNNYSILIRN